MEKNLVTLRNDKNVNDSVNILLKEIQRIYNCDFISIIVFDKIKNVVFSRNAFIKTLEQCQLINELWIKELLDSEIQNVFEKFDKNECFILRNNMKIEFKLIENAQIEFIIPLIYVSENEVVCLYISSFSKLNDIEEIYDRRSNGENYKEELAEFIKSDTKIIKK